MKVTILETCPDTSEAWDFISYWAPPGLRKTPEVREVPLPGRFVTVPASHNVGSERAARLLVRSPRERGRDACTASPAPPFARLWSSRTLLRVRLLARNIVSGECRCIPQSAYFPLPARQEAPIHVATDTQEHNYARLAPGQRLVKGLCCVIFADKCARWWRCVLLALCYVAVDQEG